MGSAQYYSIVMRTITFHTINVLLGALENYTKSNNNYNKVVNKTLIGNRGHGKNNNNNNNFISIALLSYVQGALQSCKQHY